MESDYIGSFLVIQQKYLNILIHN